MRDVILHAFNWKYQDIIDSLDEIHELGYGAILIPQPLYSNPNNSAWWQRYQPKDYRVMLSYLGNKKDLEILIKRCHEKSPKIRVYVDIVINHMANEDRFDRFNFPGSKELEDYQSNHEYFDENKLYGDLDYGLFSIYDFNRQGKIEGEEWGIRSIVQNQNLGDLPDLKDSPWVLKQQTKLFKSLIKMGFDGFRIDAVKHITERMIDNIADHKDMAGKFIFGEILTTSDTEERVFLRPFLRESWISAYDFPLFITIKEAFGFGGSLRCLANPEDQGNSLPWDRSVTFVVNHDLPYNDGFRSLLLDKKDEELAYAYIIGKDGGVPLIFSDHGESANDHKEDTGRWQSAYKRQDIAKLIKFHNQVHGTTMHILYCDDLLLVFRRSNKGIIAINKSGKSRTVEFTTWGLKNPGEYQEMTDNRILEISGNTISIKIPSRTAQAWLCTDLSLT